MILLLGANSFIGQAFAKELRARGEGFIPLSRDTLDYTRFELLFEYVRSVRPDFLINAGTEWDPSRRADSEHARTELFQVNTLLPQVVGRVCTMANLPWGHVSSACVFSGAKVYDGSDVQIEADINSETMRWHWENAPEHFIGFNEYDPPNCCFRSAASSYVAGTVALAEEWLASREATFVWRAGVPFDDSDHSSNLLYKLSRFEPFTDRLITVSHLGEFVSACLHLVQTDREYGLYNISNPGTITLAEVVAALRRGIGQQTVAIHNWDSEPFMANTLSALTTSCILDPSKVIRAGANLRPALTAIEQTVKSLNDRIKAGDTCEPQQVRQPILKVVR